MVKFRDENGRAVCFKEVTRVWGCGGTLEGKATVVRFADGDTRIVKGNVNRVGPRIMRLQTK